MERDKNQFGPVFSGGTDVFSDALVGYTDVTPEHYVLGYKLAADRLVAAMLDEKEPLDVLIYPTLFLYRHYLELWVKAVWRMAEQLHGRDDDPPKSHNLSVLWGKTVELLSEHPDAKDFPDLDLATHVIGEFASLDKGSTIFRYSDKPKQEGKNPLDEIGRINIRQLFDAVNEAAEPLEGLAAWLLEILTWRHETGL